MATINVFGDFCVRALDGLAIGESLQGILDGSDINIVNFEAPIQTSNSLPILKSGPSLYQDVETPRFLREHKFNMFTLANNHIMDFGKSAALGTTKAFLGGGNLRMRTMG